MKPKPSRRFNPSVFTEKLVPILLVVILMGLLAVFIVIALALLGFTPGA
jgi:hypothetical protein